MSEALLLDQVLNLQVPVSEAGDADPSPVVSKVLFSPGTHSSYCRPLEGAEDPRASRRAPTGRCLNQTPSIGWEAF